MNNRVKKPPIGIEPRFIFLEKRLVGLLAAIERYLKAGLEPLQEWEDELLDICTYLETRGDKQ